MLAGEVVRHVAIVSGDLLARPVMRRSGKQVRALGRDANGGDWSSFRHRSKIADNSPLSTEFSRNSFPQFNLIFRPILAAQLGKLVLILGGARGAGGVIPFPSGVAVSALRIPHAKRSGRTSLLSNQDRGDFGVFAATGAECDELNFGHGIR